MFSPFLLFSRLVFSPSSLVDDFSPGHSSLRYTSSRRLVVLVYNCIQRTYTLQHIRYTNNFSKYTISSLPHIISNYRPSTDNRITYICILNVAFFPPLILAIRTRRLRSRRVDVEFVVLSSIVLLFDRLACRSREREREREREGGLAHREPDGGFAAILVEFSYFSATRLVRPQGYYRTYGLILGTHQRIRVRAYTCTYTRGNNRVPATRFPGRRRKGGGGREEEDKTRRGRDEGGGRGEARFETVAGGGGGGGNADQRRLD